LSETVLGKQARMLNQNKVEYLCFKIPVTPI